MAKSECKPVWVGLDGIGTLKTEIRKDTYFPFSSKSQQHHLEKENKQLAILYLKESAILVGHT